MRISRTVEIKQAPRSVWAHLEDFDSWSKWATPLGTPRRITAGRWKLGWRGKLGGTAYEITDLMDTAPNYQMIWFGNQFGTTSVWTFLVEPVRGRTEVTIIVEQNGWVASLLARWRRKGATAKLAAALDGFRKLVEGSPVAPRVNQQPVSSADAT